MPKKKNKNYKSGQGGGQQCGAPRVEEPGQGSGGRDQQPEEGPGPSTPTVIEQLAGLSLQPISTGQACGTEIAGKRKYPYAPRKPPGKAGTKIKVFSNHFALTFDQKKGQTLTAFHYDFTVLKVRRRREGDETAAEGGPEDAVGDPEGAAGGDDAGAQEVEAVVLSKSLKRKVFEAMVKQHPIGRNKPAFDGEKNILSWTRLEPESARLAVILEEEGREFKFVCRYKLVQVIPIASNAHITEPAIQAIDIFLGYASARIMVPIRADVFLPSNVDQNRILFQGGSNVEVAFGWYKSAKLVQDGFMVNLDRAVTIFEKAGNLVEVVERIFGSGSVSQFVNNDYYRDLVLDEIKGMKVQVRHPKLPFARTYTVDGLSDLPKNRTFEWNRRLDDNREITEKVSVYTYYIKRYNIQLKYPNLPCVRSRDCDLPFELCWLIPDQMLRKRLSESLKAQMTKMTCQKPSERLKCIKESVASMQRNSKGYINCNISLKPHQSDARVIEPPKLLYRTDPKTELKVDPRKENFGQCSWKMEKKQFWEPAAMTKWYVIEVLEPTAQLQHRLGDAVLKEFAQNIMAKGKELGMRMEMAKGACVLEYKNKDSVERHFQQINAKHPGLQMIVIIVPQYPGVYNDVKCVGNTTGTATQCVSKTKYNRRSPKESKIFDNSYLENLMQKINGKLGGINMVWDIDSKPATLKKPCMIIGLDVTHPSPGDPVPHSIAACVASYTAKYTKYFSRVKIQGKRKEIVDLEDVVATMLKEFNQMNKCYPECIIVFRDGVSRGEFDQVMAWEVTSIKEAIKAVGEGCSPKLTFITVQKRHHVRFFREITDSSGRVTDILNIGPGTVVDTGVVDSVIFDYYLCSHYAALGTARPAHYANLYDENNFSSDELQQISYYLCYICARCPKPISIPVPVKYAHLTAEKAKCRLEAWLRAGQAAAASGINAHATLAPKLYYI